MDHVHFDSTTPYGRLLRGMLGTNENADTQLADVRNMMVTMLSGPANEAKSFGELVKRFGFGDYTATQGDPTQEQLDLALAAFTQVDTVFNNTLSGKLGRDQLYNQLRG